MSTTTNLDPSSIPGIGGLFGLLAGMMMFGIVLGIAWYVFQGFIYYKIYQKANVKYPWMSWIPIANMVPFFWVIKKSAWNLVWLIVPALATAILRPTLGTTGLIIAGILNVVMLVLVIIWMVRFLKAFRISPHWLWFAIGLIIPLLNFLIIIAFIVLLCLMAFNPNIKYNPDFDRK